MSCVTFSSSFIISDLWKNRNSYHPVTFFKGGCCSSYEMMNWKNWIQLNSLKKALPNLFPAVKALQKLFYRLLMLIFFSSLFSSSNFAFTFLISFPFLPPWGWSQTTRTVGRGACSIHLFMTISFKNSAKSLVYPKEPHTRKILQEIQW